MHGASPPARAAWAAAMAVLLLGTGCTSLQEYVHNGFKVGPNYQPPGAPVATCWIDAADVRVRSESDDLSRWWTVFQDPVLNRLTATAYQQNLSLREAGFRVLQARAQLGIAIGNIFPQQQEAFGSYRRQAISLNPPTSGGGIGVDRFFNQWALGFNLAWELDFWGRYRRAIEAQQALLDASVFSYEDVLVTLLGDIAASYVQVRTNQQRIKFLRQNVELQTTLLTFTKARLERGRATQLDVEQVESTLKQTAAGIPVVQIDLRSASNRLCVLLGIPPQDLEKWIGSGEIPLAPKEVAVGIPADLLRRRPDVRRAEREAAAQAQQIGIAMADFYPSLSVNGTLGWQARRLSHLFTSEAFNGSIGPSFQWNLLNYGRIRNNVRLQEARFCELVLAYQNMVLLANEEVENGLVTFLQAQERAELLQASVEASRRAVDVISRTQEVGAADYNRVVVIARDLVLQEDQWAQSRGQIAIGLIQVYRALGGGWEIRYLPPGTLGTLPVKHPVASPVPEEIPPPPEGPAGI